MKEIEFKSTQENFRKEYNCIKKNTVRKFDNINDKRKKVLDDYINLKINQIALTIKNANNKERFTIILSDVTKYDDYYILSWV